MREVNIKSIEFSLNDGKVIACSTSYAVTRLGIFTPPFINQEWASLSIEEKFKLLTSLFEGSKMGLPMPSNPNEYSSSVLKELGFKSWKKYYTNGYHCSIDWDIIKGEYKFTPSIYSSENDSLSGLKKGVQVLSSNATPEEIILTLEKILEKIPELTEDYYANENG